MSPQRPTEIGQSYVATHSRFAAHLESKLSGNCHTEYIHKQVTCVQLQTLTHTKTRRVSAQQKTDGKIALKMLKFKLCVISFPVTYKWRSWYDV